MPNWTGKWTGGRRYTDSRTGKETWVIEAMREGNRYSIPLNAGNDDQALAELALFNKDPVTYQGMVSATHAPIAGQVHIDEESIKEVTAKLQKDGQSPVHIASVDRYLTAWGNALKGRPLRTVRIEDLRALLQGWNSAQTYRIASLKAFCTHFVEAGLLKVNENPAALLKIEKKPAEKDRHAKLFSIADFESLYAAMDTKKDALEVGRKGERDCSQINRDVLLLRAKTGIHHTELERIAQGDRVRVREIKDGGAIAGTVEFPHKSKRPHKISLDAQALAAVRRVMEIGSAFPAKDTIAKALKRAQKRVLEKSKKKIKGNPSWLRHSFATWAEEEGEVITYKGKGVAQEVVSRLMGHASTATTGKYYSQAVPPMIKLPITLKHSDDP